MSSIGHGTGSGIESYLEQSGAKCLNSEQFAEFMDKNDHLAKFKEEFCIPKLKYVLKELDDVERGESECIYFCGNSLGLQCKKSSAMIQRCLQTWADQGVLAWFQKGARTGSPCWTSTEELEQLETNYENVLTGLVGGKATEVAVTGTLTQNLNSLLLSFYVPTTARHKVLMEAKAFPSDRYAVENQIQLRGYSPDQSLLLLRPRDGEYCLRTEDILETIEREGNEIALILLPGIQYYTGQFFDIEEITTAGHKKGCFVGWDLAHAVGNVPLRLHDWNVDFAVWCSYKYLNGGPGGIGGLFLHEKHALMKAKGTRMAGWWGLHVQDRFKMEDDYIPRPGAAGFRQSTTDIMSLSSLLGSLQLFHNTNMETLRKKSLLLTGYLEHLLKTGIPEHLLSIITPANPEHRGCQLSLILKSDMLERVCEGLLKQGIVVDERNPDCIRVAPVPMYSSFEDVRRFVQILTNVLESISEN